MDKAVSDHQRNDGELSITRYQIVSLDLFEKSPVIATYLAALLDRSSPCSCQGLIHAHRNEQY
jgi:hypothetical protein